MALTKRQKEFLEFLAGFLEKRGYSPSYEEIAEGLELASLATVHKHILALESKEYLKRGFNQSRSLEVAPKYYDEQRQHRQMPARVEVQAVTKIFFVKNLVIDRVLTYSEYRLAEAGVSTARDPVNTIP